MAIGIAVVAVVYPLYKQGSFQVSSVELGFDNKYLQPDRRMHIFMSVDAGMTPQDLVLLPVHFKLTNTGDRQLEGVLLTYRYEKAGRYAAAEMDQFIRPGGASLPQNFAHESRSTDKFDFSNFSFQKFNVKATSTIGDAVFAYEIEDEKSVDRNKWLGADIEILLEASNLARREFSVGYRIVNVTGPDALVRWYQKYATMLNFNRRLEMSGWQYFRDLIFHNDEQVAILIWPEYRSVPTPDGRNIWIPQKLYEQVAEVKYRPFSWSLLVDPPR